VLSARIAYAFRLFCAIYGHQPVVDRADRPAVDVILTYLVRAGDAAQPTVLLTRGYRARSPHQPAPPPMSYTDGAINTLLHFSPSHSQSPDWLGEIFEWVSCADEYSVTQFDEVDRPLFSATYAGAHGISTHIPYAAIAMQCLQRQICRAVPRAEENPRAPQGLGANPDAHYIVPTHDVDYFPAGRLHAINRLVRNAVISSVLANRPVLGVRQAVHAARVAAGVASDPLDTIALLAQEERRRGIPATFNFLVQHAHRLDATYTIEHNGVASTMRWLQSQGMEIGLHGSYTCLDSTSGVRRELAAMHAHGFHPQGVRQHWLRYTLDRLIPAIERAGLHYDTSIGWSARVGFRAGACFAFPPYNFAEERPAAFLEIPLVMMDQALRSPQNSVEQMLVIAEQALSESRRFGWGGISVLWHPTAFGSGWLPPEIGDVFWRLADARSDLGDRWMTAADFAAAIRHRYVETGLLPAAEPEPAQEWRLKPSPEPQSLAPGLTATAGAAYASPEILSVRELHHP
jgi:hypothetical protein